MSTVIDRNQEPKAGLINTGEQPDDFFQNTGQHLSKICSTFVLHPMHQMVRDDSARSRRA